MSDNDETARIVADTQRLLRALAAAVNAAYEAGDAATVRWLQGRVSKIVRDVQTRKEHST